MAPLPVPRSRTCRRGRQQFQRGFHQQLGVRTRDQRVRRHFQVELPEPLLAQDVGHRLAAAAALQVVGERQRRFAADDALRPGVQKLRDLPKAAASNNSASRRAVGESGRSAARSKLAMMVIYSPIAAS
jgi:hypothetical protein